MDHVKGALEPLFPKVVELLKLVESKMQIDLNKEVESLEVEVEMESLKRELVSLQRTLQFLKAEGRYIDADLGKSMGSRLAVEVWAEVRELSYDVEDVVDNYLVFLESSEPIPDIDMLKKLVQKMADLHLAPKIRTDAKIEHFAARPASATAIDPSVQAMYTEISRLVGMRGNMDRLKNMVAMVTSEHKELLTEVSAGTSEYGSSNDPWPVQDDSQCMPSRNKPMVTSEHMELLTEVPAGTSEYGSSNDPWPVQDDSQCMPSRNKPMVTSEHMELLTEVPAGTSEYGSSNDPWQVQDDSQCMPSRNKPIIACVFGFGGLGKTTLVRSLYDETKKDFSCDAFVSVGQNANEKKVLMDILLSLEKQKDMKSKKYTISSLAKFDVRRLLKELAGFLFKKRYLIVIDDIWKEKLWELIECAFRNERHLGSQVFTTTRSVNVAKACCSSSDGRLMYQMEPLSDEDSRSLFCSRVFSQAGGECPPSFKQVSAAILEKCGGVPLAIITIASLLASNGEEIKPIDEWNNLLKSIGRGLTEGDSVAEMNGILSPSYADLPPELKNCLLYTTVFSEDRTIKKDHLVSMWIAEGFVQRTNQEDSLFAIAENYFNMLINRSLIEPVNIDGEGTARACRIHDMVLGFLCSLSTEANFVTIVDGGNRTASNSETKIRRLSIQDCMTTAQLFTAQLSTTSMGMAHVRSLTVSRSTVIDDLVPPLSSYQALRVLDFTDCSVVRNFRDNIHLHIISLLHVRYLGLRRAHFSILPTDVGKLRFLQILDLRNTFMEKLPSSIVELRELIYLRVYPVTRLPDEFGKLTSLEKLTHLQVNQGSAYVAKQLGYLTKLRVLRISPCGMDESLAKEFVESLNKLLEIRILEFKSRYVYEIPDDSNECIRHMEGSWKPSSHLQKFQASDYHCFHVLPKWIIGSSNISSLSIYMKKVRRDDIEILGMLQNLRYLKLIEKCLFPTKLEEGFQFENDLFPIARELCIGGTVTLPSMFPEGAMPKVQILEFHVRLDDFGSMNLEMGHLPVLKEVKVNIWIDKDNFNSGMFLATALKAAAHSHHNRPTCYVWESHGYECVTVSKVNIEINDEEALDVQAGRPPLPLTEIGEPSGLAWKGAVQKRPPLLQLLDPEIAAMRNFL